MLHKTASTEDTHWFRFRPGMDADLFIVEWPQDMSIVELDADVVGILIANNWARAPNADEIVNYNAALSEETKP
jgi:hypothetical protein